MHAPNTLYAAQEHAHRLTLKPVHTCQRETGHALRHSAIRKETLEH